VCLLSCLPDNVCDYTAQQKKILGALVFWPVPGVIWGADSENFIG